MSLIGQVISFFPLLHILAIVLAVTALSWAGFFAGLILLIFAIYGLPVLVFRLHQWIWPIQDSEVDLAAKGYAPWWGTYKLQCIFIGCPALEALLRMIPGAFSFWLRLWGSQVGKRIVWTPKFSILDRSFLQIGDDCVLGHDVQILTHFIRRSESGKMLLYLKTVKIGDRVMIGAASRLGPGATLESKVKLHILTDVYPGARVASSHKPVDREIIRV